MIFRNLSIKKKLIGGVIVALTLTAFLISSVSYLSIKSSLMNKFQSQTENGISNFNQNL